MVITEELADRSFLGWTASMITLYSNFVVASTLNVAAGCVTCQADNHEPAGSSWFAGIAARPWYMFPHGCTGYCTATHGSSGHPHIDTPRRAHVLKRNWFDWHPPRCWSRALQLLLGSLLLLEGNGLVGHLVGGLVGGLGRHEVIAVVHLVED